MKTSLDCIPCLMRQTLEAAKMISEDPILHEQIMREALQWAKEMDLDQPPPAMAQYIHRRLREMTGVSDPYLQAKAQQNRIALELLPALRTEIQTCDSPLMAAVRVAIAGNMIDMGVNRIITEGKIRHDVKQFLTEPFYGEQQRFFQAVEEAHTILYLTDNAGEIAFDRLLIEELLPRQVTVGVRGSPVLNDATRADAEAIGLGEIAEVIDNGSDAPGTFLDDCSQDFCYHFKEADLIIAKGQGNFETLSDQPGNIFFLLKVKCPIVAAHMKQPVGMQVLIHPVNVNSRMVM